MKGLNGWLRQLEGSKSAVMASLLKELELLTMSERSSGMQVGELIMRDASLTSNIIRVGNSTLFNASAIPVTTVSRAILNIGFEQIRSIAVSLKLIESVLNDKPSELLLARLANSLHAAAQAKALVSHKKPSEQEEVYVAALLSNLTELLVLSAPVDDAEAFSATLNSTMTLDKKNAKAERTLGVSLSRLAKTLMKRWRIEGLVHDVLQEAFDKNDALQAIYFGEELSRCAQFGWDSPELQDVLEKLAEIKGVPVKELKEQVVGVAEDSEKAVKQYGKVALQGRIVSGKPVGSVDQDDEEEDEQGAHAKGQERALLQPDPTQQLQVLQELTGMVSGDININKVFKKALQGMNKGVGLERCCLAVFDKTHLKLVAKHVQGQETNAWKETFVVNYVKSENGFLYRLFNQQTPVWVSEAPLSISAYESFSPILHNEYKGITGAGNFFIAPLIAKGRRIGFIYADMGISNRDLSEVLFDGFKLFVQQAMLALSVLANKQLAD